MPKLHVLNEYKTYSRPLVVHDSVVTLALGFVTLTPSSASLVSFPMECETPLLGCEGLVVHEKEVNIARVLDEECFMS